jgi:hypothetical protein
MSEAAIYHRNALKCYRLADEAADEETRASWLAIGLNLLQRAQAARAVPKLPQPVSHTSKLIMKKHKRLIRPIPAAERDVA